MPKTAQELVGKAWLYQGREIRVTEINGNGLHIMTERQGFKFETQEDLDYFLANIRPAPNTVLPLIVADHNGENIAQRLLAGLVDDFEEMKKNPAYVPQAKQRSNQVNTIMNVLKTQVLLEKHRG